MSVGSYALIRQLGAGAYSKVWLAAARGGESVAIKSTVLPPGADRKQQECFLRAQEEASFMKLLAHPNLVPIIDSIQEGHEDGHASLHVVLPYYAGGDLLDYLRKKRCLSENEARLFFGQICTAVNSMHNCGLIHRDLKLENFFLSADARTAYVGDFGFAGAWSPSTQQTKSWGSIHYASPEICSSSPYYGPEVDLWSLGVVLYALLCGKLPFNGENDFGIYQQILASNPPLPSSVSADATQLLKGLLNPQRAARIDMQSVMTHPWLQIPVTPPSPLVERRGSQGGASDVITPLNMERLQMHHRRGSNALIIKSDRRGSGAGLDDAPNSPSQRSPSSCASSPKSAGSRIESARSDSPNNTPPGGVTRRPSRYEDKAELVTHHSRFINLATGGRRFSISSLTAKLVNAVVPGRSGHDSQERADVAGSPPIGGVFTAEHLP